MDLTTLADSTILTHLESTILSDLEERATHNSRTPQDEAKAILTAALATKPLESRDEWGRGLLESARAWGVSFSNEALSREELYE